MKKLLLSILLMVSASLLNAADETATGSSILSGVTQLSKEQMQATTGEDLYYYYFYPATNKIEIIEIYKDNYVHGYLLINYDKQDVIDQKIWYGPIEDLIGENIIYRPVGY